MNKDIFEGKWKQIRGEAKVWWARLKTSMPSSKIGSIISAPFPDGIGPRINHQVPAAVYLKNSKGE